MRSLMIAALMLGCAAMLHAQDETGETSDNFHGSAIVASIDWSGSCAATSWSKENNGWWLSLVVGKIDRAPGSVTLPLRVKSIATARGSILTTIEDVGSVDMTPSNAALRDFFKTLVGRVDPSVNIPKRVRITYTVSGVLTFRFLPQ